MAAIVVTGSLNADFVVRVHSLPQAGETVAGSAFTTIPGGKGANQAVAAGRLGGNPAMIGCVGADPFGPLLLASLRAASVDVSGVETVDGPTGVAMIAVDREGQNSIIVAAGANGRFRAKDHYHGAKVALFQLESPLEEVRQAMRFARAAGAHVILDPAPAQPLDSDFLALADLVTPNETEAAALGDSLAAARAVIYKLGAAGARYVSPVETVEAPGFPVTPLDTTAAGDCFNGALAVALAEDLPMPAALRFANAAAAISVTRAGAQPSMPRREEVSAFLQSR
jgi:ribokinase